jgi:copper chaperone
MSTDVVTRKYLVPGMTCGHCVAAVTEEVSDVAGVVGVAIDLDTKVVAVSGTSLNDTAIRDAIIEAGFDVAETG